MPHTELNNLSRLQIKYAVFDILLDIFPGIPQPIWAGTSTQLTRNEQIRQRYAEGEFMSELAKEFGISFQRISQIVHYRRS